MPTQVVRAKALEMAKGQQSVPDCEPVYIAKLPQGGIEFYSTFGEAQSAEETTPQDDNIPEGSDGPEDGSDPDEDPFKPK